MSEMKERTECVAGYSTPKDKREITVVKAKDSAFPDGWVPAKCFDKFYHRAAWYDSDFPGDSIL